MKTISKLLLSIFIITLISCESDEQATSAIGDAFILVKANEQDTIYGLALHAFTNKNFTTVSASLVENIDVSYDLAAFQGRYSDFFYETNNDNYGTELPQTGSYNFAATVAAEENISFSDNLTDDIIYPPSITACVFDDTDSEIDIEWEDDDDVDVYSVKVYSNQGTLVFASTGLNPDNDTYSIGLSTNGWVNNYSPNDDEIYTVEVNAFLYEAVVAEMNLQCHSTNKHEVTWGS